MRGWGTGGGGGGKEGGRVLPSKMLMRMWLWMRSHFHNWIDYHGITFSFSFLTVLHTGTRMFVL